MPDSETDRGTETRRAILGSVHVERARAQVTAFDQPFQELITAGVWGRVWSRPELDRRERSLLTIALLAALGHWDEFAMHIRATRNTGASPTDVREALMHVAAYAGVPAANHAIKVTRQAYAEIGIEV